MNLRTEYLTRLAADWYEMPVDAFVIGMENKREVDQNVQILEELSRLPVL